MMPYSDTPPPFVLPATRDGYRYASENIDDSLDLKVQFCTEYKDGSDMPRVMTDYFLPIGIEPCKSRRRDGWRHHNWCFRCMAGFPSSYISDEDKERASDLYRV